MATGICATWKSDFCSYLLQREYILIIRLDFFLFGKLSNEYDTYVIFEGKHVFKVGITDSMKSDFWERS